MRYGVMAWSPTFKRVALVALVAVMGAAVLAGVLYRPLGIPRASAAPAAGPEAAVAPQEVTAPPQAAAVDYFLNIDGIPGESTDDRHRDEIDVLSWSWGAANTGSARPGAGGGGAGRVSMQDFHFTMTVNKASPSLMLACATGQHIREVVLTARKAGESQQEFLVIRFEDVLISSYQTGGSSDGLPTEQVSLNFSKIEFEYRPQNPDGSLGQPVREGWDLRTNRRV